MNLPVPVRQLRAASRHFPPRLRAGAVACVGADAVALHPGRQIAPKVAFAPLFIMLLIPECGQALAQKAPDAVAGLLSHF